MIENNALQKLETPRTLSETNAGSLVMAKLKQMLERVAAAVNLRKQNKEITKFKLYLKTLDLDKKHGQKLAEAALKRLKVSEEVREQLYNYMSGRINHSLGSMNASKKAGSGRIE